MTYVDTLVLGGGPGGYVAAIRAAQLGRSVAIVENRWWGGVCLNVGCIPTKALLRNAEIADLVTRRAADYGVSGDIRLDYATGWRRSRAVADQMARGVSFLLKKNGVQAVTGWGTFTGPRSLQVNGDEWQFGQAIIATGAVPKTPPGVPVGGRVMTYEQLIMRDTVPKSLVIAGSGAIGVEFASIMAAFGCEVTIVEALGRLLPGEDESLGGELARAFRKRGIKMMVDAPVTAVAEMADGVQVRVGEEQVLQADALLLAFGFSPRTDGFGLEATGVGLDPTGFIEVDEMMRTNVPGIFAIGDVTGKLMLAHVASAQGMVAAEAGAGLGASPIDYRMMPRAIYSEPQVAAFGLTADQAGVEGREVLVSRFPLAANGKANGLGQPTGFVQLVADANTHQLVGAQMVGPDVTELLPELVLAADNGLPVNRIASAVHAHPTLSEAVMQAAMGIGGKPIDI